MKILIVTHYFLPHKGGIEFVAYNQAKELVKQGHQVTIVSSKIGDEPEEETMDGIKVRRVRAWNIFEKKLGVPYPIFYPKIFNIFNKEINNADIVHVHDIFYLSPFFASLIARLKKKPIILMQHVKTVKHSKWFVNLIQWIVRKTYGRFIANSSKKILVCNEDVGKWVNKPEKINFIENSVDINLFKPVEYKDKIKLRKKYNLPINKPIIIFVGRLVEVKGFDKLFEARNKDYFILFIGDGKSSDLMKKDKNTLFLQSMDQNKLKEFYQASDIFCLPSKSEGFPLTVLEAMASGLPIIVSDLPVYKKHLDTSNILIIKSNPDSVSPIDIEHSIRELINNKSLYKKMSDYSRKEAVKKFSWDNNVKKLIKIYNGVSK